MSVLLYPVPGQYLVVNTIEQALVQVDGPTLPLDRGIRDTMVVAYEHVIRGHQRGVTNVLLESTQSSSQQNDSDILHDSMQNDKNGK